VGLPAALLLVVVVGAVAGSLLSWSLKRSVSTRGLLMGATFSASGSRLNRLYVDGASAVALACAAVSCGDGRMEYGADRDSADGVTSSAPVRAAARGEPLCFVSRDCTLAAIAEYR
jgi:hypothetical protein